MRKKSLLLALSLDSWPAQFCTNGIRGFFSANVTRLELGSEYVPNRNLSHCMPAVVLGHLNFYAICLTVTLFPEKYLKITDAMTGMSLESLDCLEYPGRKGSPVKESVAGVAVVADPVWTWVTSDLGKRLGQGEPFTGDERILPSSNHKRCIPGTFLLRSYGNHELIWIVSCCFSFS